MTLAPRVQTPPIPSALDPLLGREEDAAEIVRLVSDDDVRLLTLTGPGGVGKTRLALHVVAQLAERFPDGAFFIELAPITDPMLVWPTVARALGISDGDDVDHIDRIARELGRARVLVVLDNLEQVASSGREIPRLLERCPEVVVIVTSRVTLRVRGAHEYQVSPLAVPNRKTTTPDQLLANAAVRLFAHRARALSPDFRLTVANAPTIAEICARLDGLPLAIELAAGRSRLLSPEALLARLSGRLRLLVDGPIDAPDRARTLRGAIAWSYDLLTPIERAVFRRLAVFSGGFTVDAAEAVCSGPITAEPHMELDTDAATIVDALSSLIDKSLLRRAIGESGSPRLSMLETVREFALERLDSTGEAAATARRHAQYLAELIGPAEDRVRGPVSAGWLEQCEEEADNLRSALGWAIAGGEESLALRIAGGLGQYWTSRGQLGEGRSWLERALAIPSAGPTTTRGWALIALGRVAWRQGELESAAAAAEEATSVFRAVADSRGIAAGLADLGTCVSDLGDLDRGSALYEEALTLFVEAGDERGAAIVLNNLGSTADVRNDFALAQAFYERALDRLRTLDDPQATAIVVQNLAEVRQEQGDYTAAAELYRESVSLWRAMGDRWGMACALPGIALLFNVTGDAERAARLFGAAEGLLAEVGGNQQSGVLDRVSRGVAAARAQLGDQRFETEISRGRALSFEQIAREAMVPPGPDLGQTILGGDERWSAADLRKAIDDGELTLHYQPQVDLRTNQVVGIEALVRWQHPDHGLLSPGSFIRLAEETELILSIDRWVCAEACRQASAWQAIASNPMAVSVNLSARHLHEPGLADLVAGILGETGLPPRLLKLEITEQAAINDLSQAQRTLGLLRDLGVQIAIDDFGVGYASLSYLRHLPADTVKIDRSFVRRVTDDARDRRIVLAMTTLIHDLGMDVTAEGVETEQQASVLRELNCDRGQGYFWSAAVPANIMEDRLKNRLARQETAARY